MEDCLRGPLIRRRGVLAGGLALALGPAAVASTTRFIAAQDGRRVRISRWRAHGPRRGLILFSHGALSTPEKYERLLTPWAERGFEILAPLHVDSESHPDRAKYAMADSWRTRLLDMRALAQLAGAKSYVAAGHSYGGLVALTLGGASATPPPAFEGPLRDPRARCVVAFSPPGPAPGLITAQGYGTLAVPALIQTGDRDVPFGSKDGRWQVHLTAYDAAPPGDKFALVLEGVDHYFGGVICRPELPGPPQTAAFERALAVSTAFLEAYGGHDPRAGRKLDAALSADGPVQLTRK